MARLKHADPLYDKIELALIYADDGAPRTAAKYLREAADEYERRADQADAFVAAVTGQNKTPSKRGARS